MSFFFMLDSINSVINDTIVFRLYGYYLGEKVQPKINICWLIAAILSWLLDGLVLQNLGVFIVAISFSACNLYALLKVSRLERQANKNYFNNDTV